MDLGYSQLLCLGSLFIKGVLQLMFALLVMLILFIPILLVLFKRYPLFLRLASTMATMIL